MARLTNADVQRFKLNLSKPSWATAGFHGKDAFYTHSLLRLCPGAFEFHVLSIVKEGCYIASDKITHYSFQVFIFLLIYTSLLDSVDIWFHEDTECFVFVFLIH